MLISQALTRETMQVCGLELAFGHCLQDYSLLGSVASTNSTAIYSSYFKLGSDSSAKFIKLVEL